MVTHNAKVKRLPGSSLRANWPMSSFASVIFDPPISDATHSTQKRASGLHSTYRELGQLFVARAAAVQNWPSESSCLRRLCCSLIGAATTLRWLTIVQNEVIQDALGPSVLRLHSPPVLLRPLRISKFTFSFSLDLSYMLFHKPV